jgi:hypothetical protein
VPEECLKLKNQFWAAPELLKNRGGHEDRWGNGKNPGNG